MKRKLNSIYGLFGALICSYLFLSNSGNPPNGHTGSPADGGQTCAACHSGASGTGNAVIEGLPATIMPSTSYPITVRITRTNMNRVKAGFQLMALDGNDQNVGNLSTTDPNATTQFQGGFEYFEHDPALNFPANNEVVFTGSWLSPASASNPITFYAAANLANGTGSTDGDDIQLFTTTGDMSGGGAITVDVTGTNVSCFGGNDGSATASASGGGGAPYTFAWSNGGSSATINNLVANTYTVTVTNGSGGMGTASIMITQPATAVSVAIVNSENITCFNPVGSATASAAGGTPGYTYAWSTGASGATVSLPAGTHFVTATDNNDCTAVTSVTITSDVTPPFAFAGPAGTITCANPTTTLNGTGSTSGPGITYQWSGPGIVSGGNTLMPVVNQGGTYTLVVTDTDNGCTDSDFTTVTSNIAPPTSNAGADMTLTCTTTQVTLNGNGSSQGPNFTYLWTGPGIVSGANTLTPVVNAVGTYTLTVTNNANGCTATDQASVSSNTTAPLANAGANMTLTCTTTQVTLNGSGSSSGANFTYQWTTTNGNIVSGANTNMAVVDAAGTYTLTVTNTSNGCTSSDQADVTQNITAPTSNAGADMTLTCTTTQVTLNGGGSSSGSNFIYLWTTSNGNIVSGANTLNPVVNQPGTYCLLVTNVVNGCTATDCVSVAQNVTPPIANIASPSQLTCTATQVTLNGSASSGTNLSFLWTTTNGNIVSGANTSMAVVNAVGNYTLTVTNGNNGCTDSESVAVSANTTPPNADAGPGMALNCNVSSVVLNGSGSSQGANFTYQWSGPGIVSGGNTTNPTVNQAGDYVILVTNSTTGCTSNDNTTVTLTPSPTVTIPVVSHVTCNGSNNGSATASGSGGGGSHTFLWSNGANTAQISNLAAANYTVTLTDADGCTATATVTITQPAVLLANAQATNETVPGANDGSATANPTGGTPVYQYFWNTGAVSQTIANLAPGNYSVTVTDVNGCTKSESVSVQSSVCTGFGVSIVFTNPSCNNGSNGSAAATPSGGNAPYGFAWSNGATTATVNNLPAGTFTVTVSDENGCEVTGNVTLSQPAALTSGVEQQSNVACNGNSTGTATIAAAGGTPNYNFAWSNGASGATQNNLPAGSYTITTTDANGCTTTISVNITQPPALAGTLSVAAETSVGADDGTAAIATSGGVAPYSYAWSNGATTAAITNLSPGEYCVSVTDQNGCVFTACGTVQAFNCGPISAAISSENISCFGEGDGTATVVAAGFTNPTYLWSNGSTGAAIGNLSAGTYSVTVSDDFNCTASASVQIVQPALLAVELLEVQHLECQGQTSGLIRVNGTGGTAGYAFIWSNGATEPSIFNLGAGNYEVTLSDANDCTATFSQSVNVLPDTEPPVAQAQNLTLFLDGNGSANITVGMVDAGSSDNCGLDSIAISQSNFDCGDIGENPILLVVVDAAGNVGVDTAFISILDNTPPVLECPSNISVIGDCNSTVTYDTPQGSDNCSSPNVFLFTGLPSGSVFPNGTTEITWAADDGNGNTVFCTFNVTVESTFNATGTFTPPTCAEFEDATATVTATGGIPPYGYEWDDPANQLTQTATGLAAGEYHATVTDANGCVTAATVVVTEPEALKIGVEQVTPETNNGMNGAISVALSGGTGNYLFEWTLNGAFFSNLEDLTGLDAGSYVLQVTDAVGCTVLDTVIVESILAASDLDLESRLSLQPNPTGGKFFLQLDLPQSTEISVALLDLTGRPVQPEWKGSAQRQSLAFDLSNQPPGVYLLRLVANEKVAMRKVVLN